MPSSTPEEAREEQARRARKGRTVAEAQLGKYLSGNWQCWGQWVKAEIVGRHGKLVEFALQLELADGVITKATPVPDSEIARCLLANLMADEDGEPRSVDHQGASLEMPVRLQGWK